MNGLNICYIVLFPILTDPLNGGRCYDSSRVGFRSRKVGMAMAWLEKFASEFGDKMPDSNQVHLPSALTRKDVYHRMLEEVGSGSDENVCSLSYFLNLWRAEHKNIVIPKVNLHEIVTEAIYFYFYP